MTKWEKLATDKEIEKTINALKSNGIEAVVVNSREDARKKVLEMMPKGAEVMNMTSVTLDETGITNEINNSDRFNPVRKKLMKMDRSKQWQEMNQLGAAPQWVIGSVHAVTQDGKVLVASNSGSQLPAYAYCAGNVIWIVGTNKIVKTFEEGLERIYEHSLPLESERAKKAYGVPGSFVSKLLVINKERPGRITMILIKENVGF